jgi:hypothetical protein
MLRDEHVLGGRCVVWNLGHLCSELLQAMPGKPTVITRKAHCKPVKPWPNGPDGVIGRELTPHGKQHVLRDIRKNSRWNAAGSQDPRNETGLRPADGREERAILVRQVHRTAAGVKMLNAGACRVSWYGEVFDLTPTNWTWTPMGSGQFASAGRPNVSYVKNPRYYNDLYFPVFPADDPNNLLTYGLMPYVPACYTRSPLLTGTGSWYCWIDLGGPGGSAGCN